jgi:deoxyhypusine synthase
MEFDSSKLATICNEEFCSKKRNCGIVIVGGIEKQRKAVANQLRELVDVFVYTPNQFPPKDSYFFNLDKYLILQITS